ncbi:MAG: CcmD family protein [Glaciecola sp.]|jgi:CcmD family protein
MRLVKVYFKSAMLTLLMCFVSTVGFTQNLKDVDGKVAEDSLKVEQVSMLNYQIIGTEGGSFTNEITVANDSMTIKDFREGRYSIVINSSRGKHVANVSKREHVEMADMMLLEGKIYVVVGVLLIVLIGMFVYLFTLNRKISKLEKELK